MATKSAYHKTTFGNGLLAKVVRFLFRSTVGAAAFAFSRVADPRALEIETTRHELPLPGLDPAFDGYRVVQFSDLHMGTYLDRTRLLDAIEQVNRLEPDLAAITGDFVTFDPERFGGDLVAGLGTLRTRDGAVAVLGNHDHWTDPYLVRRFLRDAGVHTLNNQVYTVRRGPAALHVAGLDDWIEERADLAAALKRLPAEGAAILLVHEPDFADLAAASGRFGLQLSGHTHGGQIRLPRIGAPIVPPRGRKYPCGLYRVGEMWHYTNRGLGTAELRVRWNCAPEITVFTLRSDPAAT